MLSGKVAVVTGGASGIGLVLYTRSAVANWAAAFLGRRPSARTITEQQVRGLELRDAAWVNQPLSLDSPTNVVSWSCRDRGSAP
jgi:NAD(P)-dependent dehydrogenase (short-subunit alcohol dehydrogenase family)